MEERGVRLLDDMTAVFAAHPNDCDQFAAALEAFIDAEAETLKELSAWSKTQTAEQKRAFEEKYKDRTDGMMKAMMPVVQNCSSHQGTQQAIDKIGKMME